MAQVSYGTITITDTTDLTTFIRYAKQVPLQSDSDFQSVPDAYTHYIAVLSIPSSKEEPLWNSNQWKWSEFIGTDGLSVKDTRTLYYLKTNSGNVPQVDDNTQIASTDVQNAWTSINPTYVTGGTYWTCLEVTLSDNTTKSWSTPVEDLGLTSSNSNANSALTQAIAAKIATDLMGGHFIYGGALTQQTPAGARVVEAIENSSGGDVSGDPTQWKHNVHIGSNGVLLRYNELKLAGLTTDGIHLYGVPFQNLSDNSYIQNSELISLNREGLLINRPGELVNGDVIQGKSAAAVTKNGLSIYNNNGIEVARYGDTIILGSITTNYQLTQDISVQTSKDYYSFDSSTNTYIKVDSPSGNPHDLGYYEKEDAIRDGIQIGSAELGFYSEGQKTAYVNNQKLYIPYSVVLNEMIVGTKEEYRLTSDVEVQTDKDYYSYDSSTNIYTKINNPSGNPQTQGYYERIESDLWAWKVTNNHHLRLVWKGGEEEVEGV